MRKIASKNYYEYIGKRRLQQALNHQRVKNEKALKALKAQELEMLYNCLPFTFTL